MIAQAAALRLGAKALWASSKWVIIIACLLGSHYYAYTKGSESVYKAELKQVPKLVAKEREKGVEGVRRASEDTSKIKDLERENERLKGEFEAVGDRSRCAGTASELLLLEGLRERTARKPK